MSRRILLLLPLLVLGIVGYGFYQQHRQEAQVLAQLQLLLRTLNGANAKARRAAAEALTRMQETVVKNRNQPHDSVILATATNLHTRSNQLVDTLQVFYAANTLPNAIFSPFSEASLLGPSTRAQQRLQQQLVSYAASLRQLASPDSTQLLMPALGYPPATLADLAHLESQVLASELHSIQQLHKVVGAATISSRVLAAATAESAVVAPGATYRARFFIAKSLSPQFMRMYCNDQPISVSPNGAGLVRFRAPRQPGLAAWTGKIRFIQNGLDTTFQVRVPYRVVRP